ncbi:MAG: helix-turn-helix transcriptional regulator [Burkholderiaceae bacterium]|nr:helix-turn-helix transcriptional regulator [Burkholderiaceae bacterium]
MSVTSSDQASLFDPGPGPALDAAQLSRLLERASAYFSLLSEPSRLRILRVVCYEELSVQQVVERTGLPQPNVSRHLALLNRSGVLSRRRAGTSVFYAVSDPTIVELCRLVCVRLAIGLTEKG